MSYLENLSLKSSETLTLNGAKTYSTTGNACLDLFSVAGGMRYRSGEDQIRLFDRAYIEEPEAAMKLLFYIRDIRGGMGERSTFRTLLRHVAETWPESARKNVRLISEFGRFDDLFCLLGTKAEDEVIRTVRKQLDADLAALEERKKGNTGAHISLLAKWMPSVNTSSRETRFLAYRLCDALGMQRKDYRRMLSGLRANICLTERYLTDKRPGKVQYRSVPAGAMLKYRKAFGYHDGKRFRDYIDDVILGEEKIHADTLFPYEVVRPLFRSVSWNGADIGSGDDTLEALWDSLPSDMGNENAICVVDTSGSMFCGRHGGITPIMIAVSLGLYHAERSKGAFHNHFITFESTPHLMEVHGTTLADKLRYITTAPWGGSTDLEAVFKLLLDTAVSMHAAQDELPSVLYIISDMEFNCAVSRPSQTVYRNVSELFELNGYHLPAVVFINVNSWQMQAPVRARRRGAALVSGMGVSSFKARYDQNMTPLSHMYKVLMSDRYKEVHA